MYSAKIKVENYDDDFVLLQGGSPLLEGCVSDVFLGDTPCTALLALLEATEVTDYNRCHKPGHVPESFRHVKYVEELLADLRNYAAAGGVIDEDLHWGGNWDVTFVIEEVPNTAPIASDTCTSTNKKTMTEYILKKTMTEYILPKVPERCTEAFTEYAIKVMQSDGPWLAIFRTDDTKEIHAPTLVLWNWAEWDFFIKADCVPKPIDMPKEPKRWYSRDEFITLFGVWPGNFLVRFDDKPDYLYSAHLRMYEDKDWYLNTSRGICIKHDNYTTAQYSHNGGVSWHDFGI